MGTGNSWLSAGSGARDEGTFRHQSAEGVPRTLSSHEDAGKAAWAVADPVARCRAYTEPPFHGQESSDSAGRGSCARNHTEPGAHSRSRVLCCRYHGSGVSSVLLDSEPGWQALRTARTGVLVAPRQRHRSWCEATPAPDGLRPGLATELPARADRASLSPTPGSPATPWLGHSVPRGRRGRPHFRRWPPEPPRAARNVRGPHPPRLLEAAARHGGAPNRAGGSPIPMPS